MRKLAYKQRSLITLYPIRIQTRVIAEMTVRSCCSRAVPGLMVVARVKDMRIRAPYHGLFAQERLHHRVSMLIDKDFRTFLRFARSNSRILTRKRN